jgi:hypothetical protein
MLRLHCAMLVVSFVLSSNVGLPHQPGKMVLL